MARNQRHEANFAAPRHTARFGSGGATFTVTASNSMESASITMEDATAIMEAA